MKHCQAASAVGDVVISGNMRKILPFLLLSLMSSMVAAAPAQGVYTSGSGQILSVQTATDSSFQFSLAIGVAGDQTQCSEGDVGCLSIAGEAKADAGRFAYKDPDGQGEIIFEAGPNSLKIVDATGTLGSGSGNVSQLSRITGVYRLVAQQTSAASSPATPVFFQTPSGNISCAIFPGEESSLRCDMKELKQTYTARPADCELDWGTAFGISAVGKSGEVICHGDTLFGTDSASLAYGKSLEAGGFQCMSEKSGLTCRNAAGHGFTLSKAKQELF